MCDYSQLSTMLYQLDPLIKSEDIRKHNYDPLQGYKKQQPSKIFSVFENMNSPNNIKVKGKYDVKTENKNAGRELRSVVHKEMPSSFLNRELMNMGYSKF